MFLLGKIQIYLQTKLLIEAIIQTRKEKIHNPKTLTFFSKIKIKKFLRLKDTKMINHIPNSVSLINSAQFSKSRNKMSSEEERENNYYKRVEYRE